MIQGQGDFRQRRSVRNRLRRRTRCRIDRRNEWRRSVDLTLDKMGYRMPVDAPAYQAPPYHYRNAQRSRSSFETDLDSALDALPAPLELIEPATANLSFYWYPFTTFWTDHVAILRLYARHEGKRLTYIPCSPQEPENPGRNNTEAVL